MEISVMDLFQWPNVRQIADLLNLQIHTADIPHPIIITNW